MVFSLGSLSILKDDILIWILLDLSVNELLNVEQVCKRFQALARDREIWAAKLLAFPREQWPCIGPYETREEADLRAIALKSLKTSKNWMTGNPTSTKCLHTVDRPDVNLHMIHGRYALTSSEKGITCVDLLTDDNRTVFYYELPNIPAASIECLGYDMTNENTIIITAIISHSDNCQRCMFAQINLKEHSHTFLHESDQFKSMFVLPEHWLVNRVAVKQDWVCLRMSLRHDRMESRRDAIFICDLDDLSGIFLWRANHPRYNKPDQIILSEQHSHLLLLMEVPAVMSLPATRLVELWEIRQPHGTWTLHELDYSLCDQELELPKASHVLRPGQSALSTALMSEMGVELKGKHLVRCFDARKPTWLDLTELQAIGASPHFTLTLIDSRIYSLVSNRVVHHFLRFIVDRQGARFTTELELSLFSNKEPDEMLCPMSRQGSFVSFENYSPFACRASEKGIHQVQLRNNMRKNRSWDIDYYCATLVYVALDADRHYTVNYDRYD